MLTFKEFCENIDRWTDRKFAKDPCNGAYCERGSRFDPDRNSYNAAVAAGQKGAGIKGAVAGALTGYLASKFAAHQEKKATDARDAERRASTPPPPQKVTDPIKYTDIDRINLQKQMLKNRSPAHRFRGRNTAHLTKFFGFNPVKEPAPTNAAQNKFKEYLRRQGRHLYQPEHQEE